MGKGYRPRLVRLQYADWTDDVRSKLILVAYSMSHKGNICGYYRFENDNAPTIYHWMNEWEKAEFVKDINVPRVHDTKDFIEKFL